VALLVAAGIISRLEARLPELRSVPAADPQVTLLEPGSHPVPGTGMRTSGEWVTQQVGSASWLVTSDRTASLTFTFYGTDIVLRARIGPESGRAYVTVDGDPASGLLHDARGSYLRLLGPQAHDGDIKIATGLAHREHTITITPGPEGELAIARVDVSSRTPFPWAFAISYTAILALLVFALARLAMLTTGGVTTLEGPERGPGRIDRRD
jgi:hypothetical protein